MTDELWSGAEKIIGTITDLRAKDESPETIALAAGFEFDELKRRIEELTADEP